MEHLPRGFFCVTVALTMVIAGVRPVLFRLGMHDPLALFTTAFGPHEFSSFEFLAFAVQGFLAALVSSLVLTTVRWASAIRP